MLDRILEIYGMSECSGPQLSNTNPRQKLGTIGQTLKGFHTKLLPLDPDEARSMDKMEGGEISMRGRNIMMGYLGAPDKTRETFTEDGYLRSGDIGTDDGGDYVKITGRIKEILGRGKEEGCRANRVEAAHLRRELLEGEIGIAFDPFPSNILPLFHNFHASLFL